MIFDFETLMQYKGNDYDVYVKCEVYNMYNDSATFEYAAESGYDLEVLVYEVKKWNGEECIPVHDEELKNTLWDFAIGDMIDAEIWGQYDAKI